MRVFLKTLALIIICTVVYKCTKTEYVSELEDEDPDEIGYIGENNEGLDLEDRASTLKISQVVGTDSLPIFQVANPTKKQKYGKRQILSTTAKTRFTIRGIGFGVRTDSSNVKCYIKKVEQSGVDIVSWDSTQVVVDFPVLTSQLLIDNTFSIQFKLFVKNTTVGKAAISRSRSRSCISSLKAELIGTISGTCVPASTAASKAKITTKLNELGKTVFPVTEYQVTQSYVAQIGDVLFLQYSSGFGFYAVVEEQNNSQGQFLIYCPNFLDNSACSNLSLAYRRCWLYFDADSNRYVIKMNGKTVETYFR